MRVLSLLIVTVAISAILACSILSVEAHVGVQHDRAVANSIAVNSGPIASLNSTSDSANSSVGVTDKLTIDHPLFNSEQTRWLFYFSDAALVELAQQALEQNEALQKQAARVKKAKQVVNASGHGFFPSLQQNRAVIASTDSTPSQSEQSLEEKAKALFQLWSALSPRQQQVNIDFAVEKVSFSAQVLTLTADVAEVWYRVNYQYQQLALYQQRIDTLNNALKVLKLPISNQAGDTVASDQNESQLVINDRRFDNKRMSARIDKKRLSVQQDMSRQQEHVRQQIRQLAALTGNKDKAFTVKLQTVPPLTALPGDFLPSELISREPALQIAWLKLLAENAQWATSHKARFPSFLITLQQKPNIDWQQLAELIGPLPDVSSGLNQGSPGVNQTVRQPLHAKSAAENDRGRTQQIQLEREYLRLLFSHFADIEHILSQDSLFRQQIKAVSDKLTRLQKKTQNSLVEYKEKRVDLETLLRHQEEMLDSQAQLLALEHKQRQNRIRLNRLLGGIPDVEMNSKHAI